MPQSPEFSWKDARILIADDEPDMREIFSAWLRNLGCTVTEAADGKEALEALSKEQFDAVVTDVRMPRLDGIQLVRLLNESGRYIPVIIFVSGFVDLPLPDAYDLGVEAVLSKPCHRKTLIAALRRSILRRHLVFEPGEGITVPAACVHENYSGALEDSSLALGRGGISLDCAEPIALDSSLSLAVSFAAGSLRSLRGWGVARWCERVSHHTRVGIEFMYLDDQSTESFARWLQEARPGSFIPKENRARPASRASPG